MTAVQRLLHSRLDAGLEVSELVARAGRKDDGTARITRGRVYQFISEPLRSLPHEQTIIGLARGLDYPVDIIKEAVAEDLGLLVRRRDLDPDTRVWLAETEDLTDEDRRALLEVMRTVKQQMLQRRTES